MKHEIDPTTGCHLFTGYLTEKGYGQVSRRGKKWRAHRLAWTEEHGPIPEGLDVLHTCDVRHCINVLHLFLGDAIANNRDRDAKGRGSAGKREKHGSAKLDTRKVLLIRQSLDIAKVEAAKWGVSPTAIRKVRRGETWKP